MPKDQTKQNVASASIDTLDAVVIGAGFGGMYALHSLRESGLSVKVYDAAGGVGGTWWWNCYPGATVDFPGGPFYCYTFSEELIQEWDWPETQPDQPTVLAYLNYVADKFDLRRDIQLETRVNAARYDEAAQRWTIETSDGEKISAQFLICALGTLSQANTPNIPGVESFTGECYHTGHWPHEKVEFSGKRVGVIGTGSSGIQAIPLIAKEAEHLTVFQRTPQFTIPAGNGPLDPELVRAAREDWPAMRAQMMKSPMGSPYPVSKLSSRDHTPEQRQAMFEKHWAKGSLSMLFETYQDILTNKDTNLELAEFMRGKIRDIVDDPAVVEKLLPDYYLGTKRQVLDDGYYATFNRDNVTLVDLREDAIETITPTGIRTVSGEEHALDMLTFATGYDAITGAFEGLNPRGRGGISLKEKWAERFSTYLGMTIPEFPNLFMIHGPESPTVLFNMPLGAELQSDWIRDCIHHLHEHGQGAIEPTVAAETAWGQEVADIARRTMFSDDTDSWYTGANIPGKHRQFAVYLGGPNFYRRLADVAANNYEGFEIDR
ncbi:MAG: cyclohexanone monooxygenase [Gammaproteobacteria bacterium]|nr:MAG: cyclohexanone monooxygenase [Gammaproteobacteria bacterium]RLA54320.1 MAG: cyclohexanone monooxygenase [Gammaproteobacteria bacterium]